LEVLSENLRLSESEAEQWKEQSTKLSASLTNINEELTTSHERISVLKSKLEQSTRVVAILGALVLIRIISALVGFMLALKGIKTPRWVDILL
jgi:hypothetical protein